MRTAAALLAVAALLTIGSGAAAQRRGAPPPAAEPREEPAMLICPSIVGNGVHTDRTYCDVPIGTDPEQGIIVTLPAHTGPVTLLFDLHNRHVYSEELVKEGRAYSRYTAGIGVLTMDNHVVSRAAIQSEFRTETDLFDRISAGGGSAALKAVAPTGVEPIAIAIAEEETRVSILGEKLELERIDAVDRFSTPGRPIAMISNVRVRYRPAPAQAPAGPRR